MERLTYNFSDIITGLSGTSRFFNKLSRGKLDAAISKLRDYEDAEEQGLLVRFPCKVGDTVFRVWNGEIEQYQVVSVWFNDHIKRRFHAECFPFCRFYDEDIGKTVFLTREEAEAALAKEKEA